MTAVSAGVRLGDRHGVRDPAAAPGRHARTRRADVPRAPLLPRHLRVRAAAQHPLAALQRDVRTHYKY